MKKSIFLLFQILAFAGISLSFSPAKSFIQLETGQVFHQMIDLELTEGRFPLVISRQYQQLMAGNSILGDRWCFDFEQQMKFENGGFRLYACGAPTAVFFERTGKSLTYDNEKMFEMKKGGLLRRARNSETLVYNDEGFLISKATTGGKKHAVKFFYDHLNRPTRISYLGRILLDFKLDKNGKTTGIFIKDEKVVNYIIAKNKLVLEKNAWGLEHRFEYDETGLLSQIKYPDNTTEKFSYSKETKTVNDFVSKDGCIRNFEYKFDVAKAKANLVMRDSCVKQPPLQITLRRSDVFYKNRIQKQTQRISAKQTSKRPKDFLVKRDQFNRVKSVENKKYSWLFGYNLKNGQMSTITENTKRSKQSRVYQVVYRHNKIVEISEVGRAKVNFIYSNKGKLLRVRSTATPAEKLVLISKVDQFRSILEDATL